MNLGHYDYPELAAWVADFARYLCFGLNPGHWHPNVARPNSPPSTRDDFPRVVIVSKLLRNGILTADTLFKRMAEYEAIVGE